MSKMVDKAKLTNQKNTRRHTMAGGELESALSGLEDLTGGIERGGSISGKD